MSFLCSTFASKCFLADCLHVIQLLPCVLLVIYVPHELDLPMLSFINMPSYCWLPCHATFRTVVSCPSSSTCLRIVVPAMFDVCILWGWCLHVFCATSCHLYSGVFHVFLSSMWWLEQACKLGFVMLLISVHVLLLFLCHVNLMLQRDPSIFWDTSVRMFWTYGFSISIHAPVYNYGVV